LLLPGLYTIEVVARGFETKEVDFSVIGQSPSVLDIKLLPFGYNPKASSRLDRTLNKEMIGPFKNPRYFERKDITNLVEWSFSLLNIINLLNIVSYLS
jgi:hypothetical protein